MNKRFTGGITPDLYFREINLAIKSSADSRDSWKMVSVPVHTQGEQDGRCAVGA